MRTPNWGSSGHRRSAQDLDVGRRLVRPEVQRAAAERGKAGAENDAGIDQVGALDDLLVAHTLGLADQRVDQLAAEPLQLALVPGLLGLRLLWLAVLPHVEALA